MLDLNDDQLLRLIYLSVLLLVLVGGSVGLGRRAGSRLRDFAMWGLLGIALVVAYAYREPLMRFAAPVLRELDPSRVEVVAGADGAQELVVARGLDGHFHVEAEANGAPVRFLLDTGATATVLTLSDADRSGIDTGNLEFNRPVQTANGIAFYAPARLNTLEIGPFRLSSVAVGVMRDDALATSLLGMSTIDRFASWRIEGDRLVLVP
jgi:aspartyl protease family protein